MKTLIRSLLILVFLLPSLLGEAQRKDNDAKVSDYILRHCKERKVMDKANLRILYAFNALDMKDKSTWVDEGQLKIGNGVTQYSSHFEEVNEDSLIVWFDRHPKASAWPALRWHGGIYPERWIEYQHSNIRIKGNTLEEWATMPRQVDGDHLVYTETLPLQKWKLEKDVKTICGYKCQKATTHWRGRDYEAWFAPDIPVSAGPWKFGGLPGVIMKLTDSKGDYQWEAVAVNKGDFPMYAPRGKKYKPSTREKVLKLQKDLNENCILVTGAIVIDYASGQMIPSRKHKYTPLELE